ncbi:MAG: hypothetical protein PVG19_09630 [Desulfobacterales bacterium]
MQSRAAIWKPQAQPGYVEDLKSARTPAWDERCHFIENILAVDDTMHDTQKVKHLRRLGAQILDKSAWDYDIGIAAPQAGGGQTHRTAVDPE